MLGELFGEPQQVLALKDLVQVQCMIGQVILRWSLLGLQAQSVL